MSNLVSRIDETRAAYGIDIGHTRQSKSNKKALISNPPTVSIDIKVLFRELADEWKRDTAHQSFISQRLQHPAYRRILNMGRSVVPLILEEMERQSDHWFYALALLTGENPVPADFTGTVSDAADLWIRWGRSRYAA